jgi:hypothetical protein
VFSRRRVFPTTVALAGAVLLSACGDSSGPGSVDANGALQSLALALQGTEVIGSPTTPDLTGSFNSIAPLLTKVNITVDGSSQPMFAMGFRESFPDGTCEETLFVDPAFPPNPGVCTPPQVGMALVFWQSHSAQEPPDRMLIVVADPGTVNFDFNSSTLDILPAFALYVQGQQDIWSSLSGTLTTAVTSMNQPCTVTLPPYAKSATCSFANFDEQGQIVFEPFTFEQTSTKRMTINIPQQTLHGFWLSITEVQPVTFPLVGNRLIPGMIAPHLAPRLTRVR